MLDCVRNCVTVGWPQHQRLKHQHVESSLQHFALERRFALRHSTTIHRSIIFWSLLLYISVSKGAYALQPMIIYGFAFTSQIDRVIYFEMPKVKQASPTDCPVRLFKSKQDWAAWLDKKHQQSSGLWLRLAKKDSQLESITYAEALEIALCYGWIDGQKRPENKHTWLQKFAPRSARSLWSKINRDKALALIASGEMKAAGLEAIENAKQAGRWDSAYESSSKASVPPDLTAALDANPPAKAFFATLDKANRYAVLWRIQTVKKPETRARKISQFVEMLARGEKLH